MIYAPILIPTLNRVNHLKNCIESLQRNTYAKYTDVFIALDYPPDETYFEGYQKTKDYLDQGIDGFRSVTIIKRPYNYYYNGGNLRKLIEEVSKTYDRFILAEDDIEFSPYFIEYMDNMLEIYENDDKVHMISGFSYQIENKSKKYSSMEMTFINCWGAAYWVKKREKFTAEEYKTFFLKGFRSIRSIIKCIRNDALAFNIVFNDVINGKNPKYGDCIRAMYYSIKGYIGLSPVVPLSKNNGFDSSGLHSGNNVDPRFIVRLSSEPIDISNLKSYKKLTNKDKNEINLMFKYDRRKRIKLFLKGFAYALFGIKFYNFLRKKKNRRAEEKAEDRQNKK